MKVMVFSRVVTRLVPVMETNLILPLIKWKMGSGGARWLRGSVDRSTYSTVVVTMSLSRSRLQCFESADIVEGVFGLVVVKPF
jgi:hypothetical protein